MTDAEFGIEALTDALAKIKIIRASLKSAEKRLGGYELEDDVIAGLDMGVEKMDDAVEDYEMALKSLKKSVANAQKLLRVKKGGQNELSPHRD
jgi:hypothetical protein